MNDTGVLGQKWYSLFDWPLLVLTLTVSFAGIFIIYSANYSSESEFIRSLYIRQLEWNLYGILALVLMASVDYRTMERPAYLIYVVFLILLLKVLMSGRVISGSQRWLSMAGMNFQPSELVKVVLILTLTRYYDDWRESQAMGFKQLIIPVILLMLPVILIARQPDLGTATILVVIFVVMTFINGIKKKTLIAILIGTLVLMPVGWLNLKTYQKTRVLTLLDPASDPLGSGYHVIQSKIAIGSGGLLGKGFFAGTQSKLNFLPEKHTDFIFAVFAEEAGFIGTVIILTLYLLILLRMIDIVLRAGDRAGAVLASGVTAMFAFHFFYNVAMTLGLTPIVGIPIPLLSYGGSSLLTNFAAIGLLLSVNQRRFRHE